MNGADKSCFLHNARLVLPGRVIENAGVLVADRRIVSVSTAEPPRNATVIDLQSLTIYPGFIDIHIHGAIGVDTMAASEAELSQVSEFLATEGVTGWLPTLVPAPNEDYAKSIAAIGGAMKLKGGARILGVHYEGPFVNSAQCGALRARFFREFFGAADIEDLPTLGEKSAKHMMTLAPEITGGIELARELKRRGWVVSIGHTRANFELLDEAHAAGARHMTHFMNAMSPLHHRAPGPVGWGLSRDDVTLDIIADGVHLDTRILRLLLKLKGDEQLMLISDAIAAAGKGDGEYEIWGETIAVKDGRTSNTGGSIAGSVITMRDAVGGMHSLGATEVALAKLASSNPARLLGIYQECGSIEEGKRADLVALDPDGRVVWTMIGGETAFGGEK